MTTPDSNRAYPFWSWGDAVLLAALALPTLFIGASVAFGIGRVFPEIGNGKSWIAMLVFYLLWFGSLYLVLKTKYARPFWPSLAWTMPDRGKGAILLGGPALALTVALLGALLKTPQTELPIRKMLEGPLGFPLFGVFSIILGPVTEELAFRGFFMPLLIRSLGAPAGIVLTALPFAFLHGPEYAWTWQYIVLIAAAGVAFGCVRFWTGSTLASAMMHSTYNLTFFAGMALSEKKF
jgi:membrane protease YdiL (CAAX protease family)